MLLQGYGPLLLNGTWQTIKLAILSLVFAFVLGLLGAAAKLSKNRISNGVGTVYTTLVRGVPGLALNDRGLLLAGALPAAALALLSECLFELWLRALRRRASRFTAPFDNAVLLMKQTLNQSGCTFQRL